MNKPVTVLYKAKRPDSMDDASMVDVSLDESIASSYRLEQYVGDSEDFRDFMLCNDDHAITGFSSFDFHTGKVAVSLVYAQKDGFTDSLNFNGTPALIAEKVQNQIMHWLLEM